MTDDLPTSDLPDVTAPAAPEAAAETKPEASAKPKPAAKPKGKTAAPAVADAPAAEEDAADAAPVVDSNLPLFKVESNGLQSESFHAVDESDAVRQFYKFHKIADTASRAHRVTRVS